MAGPVVAGSLGIGGGRRARRPAHRRRRAWGPSASAPTETLGIILSRTLGIDTGATWTPAAETIVWELRLPRVLTAMVVGAGLALAGATFQGLLRNPLADPFVLGTASGAALGAAIAILLPLGATVFAVGAVQGLAFVGALVAALVVFRLGRSRRAGRDDPAAADRLCRRRRC